MTNFELEEGTSNNSFFSILAQNPDFIAGLLGVGGRWLDRFLMKGGVPIV